MALDHWLDGVAFFESGGAIQRKLIGSMDLLGDIVTHLSFHSGGKGFRLSEGETAVEQIERLDGGGAFDPARGALSRIRTVESAEDGLRLTADLVGINHASLVVGREGLDRIEPTQTAALVKEIVATAMHRHIELTTDSKHRVADGFGFEATRGKAPEVTDIDVFFRRVIL